MAEQHDSGTWRYYPEDEDNHAAFAQSEKPQEGLKEYIFQIDQAPTDEQGHLMAEAINLHDETGKTPRQLAEQVKVLREAILTLEKAFITSESDGSSSSYKLVAKFKTLQELQAAHHAVSRAALAASKWRKA